MRNRELRIATWNLDRPNVTRNKLKNESIAEKLRQVDAHTLVLTETNSCIDLHESYQTCFSTTCLFQTLAVGKESYGNGENRVTIWSKFPGQRRIDICNSHSSICVNLKCDDWGELNVYGTVIGIYGKDRTQWDAPVPIKTDFDTAIETQLLDWERIVGLGSLCVAGDFNPSLRNPSKGDRYISTFGRETINNCFGRLNMEIPSLGISNNVDHIAVSKCFTKNFDPNPQWQTWNEAKDKKQFSDHMGVLRNTQALRAIVQVKSC